MDNVIATAAEAVADIPAGAGIAAGGFGLSGIPAIYIDRVVPLTPSQAADKKIERLTTRSRRLGGAIDLVHGAMKVIVLMGHVTKGGVFKIVNKCSLPLTGARVVHRIITDLAVLEVTEHGLRLVECAPGVSEDEVRSATEPDLVTDLGCRFESRQRCP